MCKCMSIVRRVGILTSTLTMVWCWVAEITKKKKNILLFKYYTVLRLAWIVLRENPSTDSQLLRKICRNRSRMREAPQVRVCFCRRRGRYLCANDFSWETTSLRPRTANTSGGYIYISIIIIICLVCLCLASTERFRHDLLDATASRVRTPYLHVLQQTATLQHCSRSSCCKQFADRRSFFFLPGK